MTIKLGCNAGIWNEIIDDVPGNNGVRSFRDTVNEIPTVWPGVPGAEHTLVSLRPHPDDLLAGRLDQQILSLLAVAAAGAQLTVWHEAGNLYRDIPYITPQSIRSSHVKMRNLCGQAGTGVGYGCIIYGDISDMAQWIPTSSYPMDWYGIDLYDNDNSNNGSNFRTSWPNGRISDAKIHAYMREFLDLARDRSRLKWPKINIGECNSPVVANRKPFFRDLADWLYTNGGRRMYTFFRDGGNSSGPWLDPPQGQDTIDGLNYIVNHYT